MEYFAATEDQLRTEIEKKLPNSSSGADQNLINNVLNISYAFIGVVAVGFIIYGGIQYSISNGDPGKITKAKHTIMYSLIGLLIVMLAAAITFFITQTLAGAGAE